MVSSLTKKYSQPTLELIQYSLRAKAVDFSKIEKQQADTEDAIEVSGAAIDEMTSSSETLASEIKTLGEEIKALDKAVAEGTEQRKEEHADFLTFQTESNAAVQLIEEEKILAASGQDIGTVAPELIPGTTQTVFAQVRVKAAPPPPPETFGAYQKKDAKSNGVIGLMEMLAKELQTDITEAEHEEENSQK